MKTAREVACGCERILAKGRHWKECDELTAIIDQARREGAEWARERAAEMLLHLAGRESWSLALAERIRELVVTP